MVGWQLFGHLSKSSEESFWKGVEANSQLKLWQRSSDKELGNICTWTDIFIYLLTLSGRRMEGSWERHTVLYSAYQTVCIFQTTCLTGTSAEADNWISSPEEQCLLWKITQPCYTKLHVCKSGLNDVFEWLITGHCSMEGLSLKTNAQSVSLPHPWQLSFLNYSWGPQFVVALNHWWGHLLFLLYNIHLCYSSHMI